MALTVLDINDTHSGSLASIRTPCEASTKLQDEIYKRFQYVTQDTGPIDVVILNGDMGEGTNPSGRGSELWTSEIDVQVKDCVNILEGIDTHDDTEWRLTYSSGYHGGHNPSFDQMLCKELRARGHKAKLHYEWALNLNDMRLHVTHSIGVAQNRVTSLEKEIEWATKNRQTYGHFDYILRAHCHYYSHVDVVYNEKPTHGFVVPGWKLRDEYVGSKGLRYNPGIGALKLLIPDEGVAFNYKPYVWHIKGCIKEDTIKKLPGGTISG